MRSIPLFLVLVCVLFGPVSGQEKAEFESDLAASKVSAFPGSSVVYPAANLGEDAYAPSEEWKLVWADEFAGEQLNADNWNRQLVEAGLFNEEWQAYTADEENVFFSDGCLVIKAIHRSDEHGINQYTSARLNTAHKRTWKYGKIAARIQMPYGNGLWPAFWMLGENIDENGGDTPWPMCGEIDIFEFYGSKHDGRVEANIHFADASGARGMMGAEAYELEEGRFADAFHVFEIEWNAEWVIWKVDGRSYASFDISTADKAEFHQPFFILLNMAVGGTWAGRPDASTHFPQVMYVDWVRVYQP